MGWLRAFSPWFSFAELAEITGFDRSRITRIMNLRLLEPGEQEGALQG